MSLNCFQSSDISFLHLVLHVTRMKSGYNYIKWAVLSVLVHVIYKNTILLISSFKCWVVLSLMQSLTELMGIVGIFFFQSGWHLEKKSVVN